MENNSNIDRVHFKELLDSLEGTDTCIKFRLFGEVWTEFSKVVFVSGNAVMYQDGLVRKIIMNLRDVMEFEIDQAHLNYLPKTKYCISRGE